ncbi:3-epi-6-deoxocathasterone 23-monooxygenase CYP90D1-like [Humulus lupulus]|uniref:3-epi-6-deoxocathasterone 23-monooxygenase CYP90D1-like n=1 Tax=Humulus lupulus TaxID=3486 RepID=UPI002B4038A6|nr:3-epi-6-deoxocathasterone 23-monooxygenase CYP90D1-like [Humulus lupulus]
MENIYNVVSRTISAQDLSHFSASFRIILRGEVVEHQNIANDLKFQQFIVYKPQNAGVVDGQIIKTIGFLNNFFLLVLDAKLKAQITRDMYKYVQESMTNWSHDRPIYIQDETKNIAFQVLVKALINLDPSEEMESLRKQFQEFIAGLMSLPINIPGTRLHRSLQAKKKMVQQV